jgi:hypothetical protein
MGWAAAIVVFSLGVALGHGLLPRVELGLVAGSFVAVIAMGLLLRLQMADGVPATIEPLLRNLAADAEIIEP